MHLADLLKSTPVKLALWTLLILTTTFVVAGFVVYDTARKDFEDLIDSRLEQKFTAISGTKQGEIQQLVEENIAAVEEHNEIFLLADENGKTLAANTPTFRQKLGFTTVSAKQLGISENYSYRLLDRNLGSYRLVVGEGNLEVEELYEALVRGFLWAGLVAFFLASAGAIIIAIQAGTRIAAFSKTMIGISNGNLNARIPISGRNDDIDKISTSVNEALKNLAASVEGMRQVSSDIAHDLKTPLSRLRIKIEGALDKADKGIDNTVELESAMQESDQINNTFSALLRISQIELGARRERFQVLELEQVLGRIADLYSDVVDDAEMKLMPGKIECSSIFGDAELLAQLFANLIENAIRHCPKGTEINYSLVNHQDTAIVTISDNGPGIPETEREKVLRRLYRLEKSRTTSGSGLGLSMVNAITKLHEAKLVLSDNAPGLAASIEFPTTKEATARS